jgi:hypothetical protein
MSDQLLKALDKATIMVDVVAEDFPFSEKLYARFIHCYKNNGTFRKSFWKAEKSSDGAREFCRMFFDHWTGALASWMDGHGRKPIWFDGGKS